MVDYFFKPTYVKEKSTTKIYPQFNIGKCSDLMIRGRDFYAIWLEDRNRWSTDEDDVIELVDNSLKEFAREYKKSHEDERVKVMLMRDSTSGSINSWHMYCTKQMRDNYHELDKKILFLNDKPKKTDYATRTLPYELSEGSHDNYDQLMDVLYSPEERHKIEWAIGAIVSGDSVNIQKFLVLYGAAGTGKSTVLNIIQQLFDGYYSVFDARALGQSNKEFALEPFKNNPLVAIQHDGDLSHIEDNTRLNSIVSHETMNMNEKYKPMYSMRFNSFLFMGTNRPVKITDAKSGIIRRLIDVSPTGNKLDIRTYKRLINGISFELGAIANYCLNVYQSNPGAYDDYIPLTMLGASNDFYNFVEDSYFIFKENDGISLKAAWEMYKAYCDDAKVPYPLSQRVFKEELKQYFAEYKDRYSIDETNRVRSYYSGFLEDKFQNQEEKKSEEKTWKIDLKEQHSLLDDILADFPAQYGTARETPEKKWADVTTTLKDIDTSKLHYVNTPPEYIVVDFDIPDEMGNKCLEKNLEAASKWPPTYAELSKSGQGVHLHYIYTGDPTKLSGIFDDHIEIKIYTGNQSLRRKLTKCNNLQLAEISSGLPLKGDKPMVNYKEVEDVNHLKNKLKQAIRWKDEKKKPPEERAKTPFQSTRQNIEYIYKVLNDTYNKGMYYDVTDLKPDIYELASTSTHHASECLRIFAQMHFTSKEDALPPEMIENVGQTEAPIAFYDIEIAPNLFLLCYKFQGPNEPVIRLYNPTSEEVEKVLQYRLIGFNCRRYDNHILYARWVEHYSESQLFNLSARIINKEPNSMFGPAYNFSYTDIYDFASKKQGLKKWEIEMGIHHQEWDHPWDQPIEEKDWPRVADYCANDVLATEALFNWPSIQADFTARKILAALAGGTVNDTTNSLTAKIIFGSDKSPQSQFNYRNMGDISSIVSQGFAINSDNEMLTNLDDFTAFDKLNRPIFPGYSYEKGVSRYRDEIVGEGGYVYAEPGIYNNVALLDIASMHPSSVVAENLFGTTYTQRFKDLLQARIAIKHKDFNKAKKLFDGKLAGYLKDESETKNLAYALKIALNSVYGLTSAKFPNAFKDPRNVDNIVAKRGALFMINLKHEVQKRGYSVAHIKTDSIKIPNATPEIIRFVMDYGKMYGYTFEHEATYDKVCLVNDAVYIAKHKSIEACQAMYGYIPEDNAKELSKGHLWTATGTQFQVPYVFKTLFSKEPIEFYDMCETKEVKTALYLDMNEGEPEDVHHYNFVGKIGQFCPIKPGKGGGLLMRESSGKYGYATGAKGYRWLESEIVKNSNKTEDIDISYYEKLVDEAVKTIGKYGDFLEFVSSKESSIDPVIDKPPWEE